MWVLSKMFRSTFLLVVVLHAVLHSVRSDSIALYPRDSETRQVQSLDGVWNFRLTKTGQDGFTAKWFEKQLDSIDQHYERMPVPSSFNDITEKREIRDFNGWVWYDRKFFVPAIWKNGNIILRFGSVNYLAKVYVNGHHAVDHTGGHLPFEADVTSLLKLGAENHITVAVNNVLSSHTLPPGHVGHREDTRTGTSFTVSDPSFDFFNYAGIHRSVLLSFVPAVRIVDLTVVTSTLADLTTGVVKFDVITNAAAGNKLTFEVDLQDNSGKVVATAAVASGEIRIPKAILWWPFTMSGTAAPGYLYRLAIRIREGTNLVDSIYQNVGIRNLALSNGKLMVNGKPAYLQGFGKHEDMNVRGRSLDQAMILKDFNLMKWIGANSFRTSHYPYSELIMDEADAQGFMVVDEVPAVGLHTFPKELLTQHLVTIRELIQRDKNRPSVFMWSIANEPTSNQTEAGPYFEKVAAEARAHDPNKRPITGAINVEYGNEHMSPSLDVLMINRYYAWYSDPGYTQVIQGQLVNDLTKFHDKFQKPIMISEYGADTVAGLHTEPSIIFTEDYQTELLIEYHKAFDTLRAKGFFIGEHIWNFADFMTIQKTSRVGGNKKGVFTRERQPKEAARLLRCRYWKLTNELTNEHRKGFSLCPNSVY